MSPEEAVATIENARAKDQFAFVEAVGRVLGEADRLRWFPWRRQLRIRLYQVVADLDGDDKLIGEGVDLARRFLESRGVACDPSVERESQQRLGSMPPYERHLMLAKHAMLDGASNGTVADRHNALLNALRHYELAAKHGDLSRKHLLTMAKLRKRLSV